MATTTCTFVYSAVTVTLPAPAPGADHTLNVPSDIMRTGGGTYGYQFGAAWEEETLQFKNVSHAQLDALLDFYSNTVGGTAREFTYNDAAGDAGHTARFIAAISWKTKNRQSPGQYDVQVRLAVTEKVT